MDTVLWCLAVIMALPYLLALFGDYYRKKSTGEIDNHNPRQQVSQLDDYGQRIYAAQNNNKTIRLRKAVHMNLHRLKAIPVILALSISSLSGAVFRQGRTSRLHSGCGKLQGPGCQKIPGQN